MDRNDRFGSLASQEVFSHFKFSHDRATIRVMSDEDVCGEQFDHDERLTSDADGIRQYECRRCGAEWIEDDSEGE